MATPIKAFSAGGGGNPIDDAMNFLNGLVEATQVAVPASLPAGHAIDSVSGNLSVNLSLPIVGPYRNLPVTDSETAATSVGVP